MVRKKIEKVDTELIKDEPNASSRDENELARIATLKVTELRSELEKRHLDSSGRKSDLLARLNTVILDEQKKLVDGNKLKESQSNHGGKRKRNNVEKPSSCEDDKKEDLSKRQRCIDIGSMTLDNLKQELSTHGLNTSGSKRVLVTRLEKFMNASSSIAEESESIEKGKEDVPEEKIVTTTKKGRGVLDNWLPDDIKCQYHVLDKDGTVYDAMLNQTNVGDNNNKFYVIQALETDIGGKYMVYNRWGRVGIKGQDKLFGPFCSIEHAINEFKSKFFDKTKNDWDDRHNFTSHPKKYTWLEMDYSETNEENTKAMTKELTVKKEPKETKLDTRVAQFISLICNVNMMKQAMTEIGYNANKLPLGKLSKTTILKGYDVLKRISDALEQRNRNDLEILSSEFYTVVPHDFGFKKMWEFIIDTPQKLKRKLEMVEALGEIELATKLLGGDSEEEEDPLYAHYCQLHCNIIPLDEDSEEVQMIKKYVSNTHAKTHSNYILEVTQVFKVSRENEDDRFDKFRTVDNRMLLWHGSRLTNWTGILSQGLRIAPPEAPVTGYMFGKGVYFADMVSKSANYCYPSSTSPVGVLMLCEVALGDMAELREANYHANKLPAGKLSTKGLGQTAPDPSEGCKLPDGVIVPLGTPKQQTDSRGSLLYNEFIVYDVEQIRMRYLLQVKFNYCR